MHFILFETQAHNNTSLAKETIFLFECLFQVRTSDFLQSFQGQTCHGCITNDIVVSLCSELIKRLFYYIHRAHGKKLLTLAPIEPGTS